MKIPTKLKINGKPWKIIIDKNGSRINGKKYMGICSHAKKTITLSKELRNRDLLETFIHEVLHACFDTRICSDKVEEKIVENLCVKLYDLLNDNRILLTKKRTKASSQKTGGRKKKRT